MSNDELQDRNAVRHALIRRLHKLEQQAAISGRDTRPEILIEIEDLQVKIATENLYNTITTSFNENELKALASYLKTDYGALFGDNWQDKARELVIYCQEHGLIEDMKQGIQQAPKGINFVSRAPNRKNEILVSWPPEIRCKACGRKIQLVDIDDHRANEIELSPTEYDFIPEDEADETDENGDWKVTGVIVCRSCGTKRLLVEKYITVYVQENYTCSKCKQAGHMTAHIKDAKGLAESDFVRLITFTLICEFCDQRRFRRKLLRSFQNITSLLISNTGVQVHTSK